MTRFAGNNQECFKEWRRWAKSHCLSGQAGKDKDTWGSCLISLLGGDAADCFAEDEIETKYMGTIGSMT